MGRLATSTLWSPSRRIQPRADFGHLWSGGMPSLVLDEGVDVFSGVSEDFADTAIGAICVDSAFQPVDRETFEFGGFSFCARDIVDYANRLAGAATPLLPPELTKGD
jgi:hypothetical protein